MHILKNYFKIAFRNLAKNKMQSSILIGGLTAGMVACIMLLMYVGFELSFDNFHSKKDNIYRVVNQRFQNGESVQKGTITYPTIGYTMREEFPEIKNATRLSYSSDFLITHNEKVTTIGSGFFADEHFLEIFDFKLIAQTKANVLNETNEIVLTKKMVAQYFPAVKDNYEAVLGEELRLNRLPDVFKIVGVCEDVPSNSFLQFNLLTSYATRIRYWGEGAGNSWTASNYYHFLELEEGTNYQALETKFADFSQRHFRGTEVTGSKEVFTLQPFSDAHLYSSDLEYEIGQTNSGRSVWSLLIISFFILLLAWINYVNLSSVRAMERSKEVGVRKVLGATKTQLTSQFIAEALIINIVSLLLAVGIVLILTPSFNAYLSINTSFVGNEILTYLMVGLLGLIGAGVLVSGAYPAWLLSSSQIAGALKKVVLNSTGGARLRKGLVVFQFMISITLITITWLVANQIDFMSRQDLGINIDQVMIVNPPEMSNWDSTFIDRMNTFKTELTKFPGIESAATSNRAPSEGTGRIFQMQKIGKGASEQSFTTNFIHADFEYAKTYGFETLTGRFFRKNDHNYEWDALDKIVINEATVKMLGFADNEKAIGKQVNFWDKNWNIIGVMPDFNQRSLHHKIEPLTFLPGYGAYHLLSLKLSGKNVGETIAGVKSSYEQFFPGNDFQYSFVNENFQRLYAADFRFRNILSFFTLFTILIASLGLFGLASYTTFLRTKEIGVRKILGAGATSIVALLSKDFLKLVLIAILFAVPLAYFFMEKWLQGFAYQIGFQWWVFLLAGVLAIGIAFLTVGLQSLKAALSNPVESLRSE